MVLGMNNEEMEFRLAIMIVVSYDSCHSGRDFKNSCISYSVRDSIVS